MRILLSGCFLLFPYLVQAEIPITFGSMTFGQPPESGMVCITGPCSTGQLRPDILQNKGGLSVYKKPVDITTYGGWEISSPEYRFFEDRFLKVTFEIQCETDQTQRCMEEVADALDQEYGLEILENFAMELSENQSFEARTYKTVDDTVIKISLGKTSDRPKMPLVVIESYSMMEKMRKTVNPKYKSVPLDKR